MTINISTNELDLLRMLTPEESRFNALPPSASIPATLEARSYSYGEKSLLTLLKRGFEIDQAMRKQIETVVDSLTVTYGIKPKIAGERFRRSERNSAIDVGWMKLRLGWDTRGRQIIFAKAGKETVLMSFSRCTPVINSYPTPTAQCNWASASDYCWKGSILKSAPLGVFDSNGYRVRHGHDKSGEAILTVQTLDWPVTWVFRDPHSHMTGMDPTLDEIPLDDGMTIRHGWTPKQIDFAQLYNAFGVGSL